MREWCLEHARIMSVWPAEPGNWWEKYGEDSEFDAESNPDSERELTFDDATLVAEFAAEWLHITKEKPDHR